jgi:hypothetical protein
MTYLVARILSYCEDVANLIPAFRYYIELLRPSESMLSRWYRLHLQSLAPTALSPRGGLWPDLLVSNPQGSPVPQQLGY